MTSLLGPPISWDSSTFLGPLVTSFQEGEEEDDQSLKLALV